MTQYFVMHIILLAVLTIAAGIATVGFVIGYFNDPDKDDNKKPKWLLISALCLVLFSGGLYWWIASANEPWSYEYTSMHDVKDVTYPDGSKVQMFTCDGTHHNITAMFGKVLNQDEWVIRRIRWNPLYKGLSWSSCERCRGDHYFLEHKAGTLPSVEIVDKPKPAESK